MTQRRDHPVDGLGDSRMPDEQRAMLRRAIRLEWLTLVTMLATVVVVYSVAGQSQAMKAAWIEDSLAVLPPLAFLVALRISRRPSSSEFPYGHHRSVGMGHLVAAVALLAMGAFLLFDSSTSLLAAERPPIGVMTIGGHVIWAGWVMIAAMVITVIPAVILGRLKTRPAASLHDKVLYADADMNRADWQTGIATIIGICGIGVGLWWADAAAAIIVSLSILRDGWDNLRGAVAGLSDARPTTFDGRRQHPVLGRIDEALDGVDWIREHGARVRDEGHVFHVEAFVVPAAGEDLTLARFAELRRLLYDVNWKIDDVVITAVEQVPEIHRPQ